ncbi:MAG: hypothetical protein JST_000689 [Candidatus Parcubacteria bacterium]|jgi:hypothetical protein|nr:MAG: hypothetical protein JST_6370 [Candidatus Parcubacteria bacterium]
MKTFRIFLILVIFSFTWLSSPAASWAANEGAQKTLDGLNEAVKGEDSKGGIGAYKSQVDKDPQDILTKQVTDIISLILSFLGIIFLVITIYAGFLWMTARGNDAQIKKAKDLLMNAIIGLVIITAAYSLTAFVGSQLTR